MDTTSVIEGTVKFRDGKKWKSRWCVMRKLSPVADCLYLQLYRDSKDRYKQGHTKASLSLQQFLGLESGFTLDKESNTVAILCQDVVVVLAFDNRERLMQWQVKLSSHLGDGPQYLVLLSNAPGKAKIQPGPARLHVQEKGFCLSTSNPPRLAGHWLVSTLRRYGVVEGKFCFEGGSRCGRNEGLYVLLTDQGEDITSTLKLAAAGQLHASRRRPVSRNMSVMDSPRRPALRSEVRNPDITDMTLLTRVDSPYTDLDSNYGCGEINTNDGWNNQPIERCLSCISKLGAMSRSSTVTMTNSGGGTSCWEQERHICDRNSISSSISSSDGSNYSQTVTRPPCRPPKPNKSPTKKPAMALPSYDNYDIPNFPYPVNQEKTDENYDTPRKIKECLVNSVRKPCGCVLKLKQPEPERPCYCQRLLSCWGQSDDINALYAQVDMSKKCNRNNPNYMNLPVEAPPAKNNYENLQFVKSLDLYENAKQVVYKANVCNCDCGHVQQNDYLMMGPNQQQPHPGYLPMSPAIKQRLGKLMSNSNPNLTKPSGSAMLQSNTLYQRKHILDVSDNIERRKRSNSADSSSRCEEIEAPAQEECACQAAVRRSSSVPSKSNRDSSSSNDSGVFELPKKLLIPSATLPRRSKSSDPLKDISFNFNQKEQQKSASAEGEVPVCPSGSTSSGTSDMSDYFETLSLSSHSSSDTPAPPTTQHSCTLRPRSGNEYLSLQRLIAPVPEERI